MENNYTAVSLDDKIEAVLNEVSNETLLDIIKYCASMWKFEKGSREESILIEESLTTENLARAVDTTSHIVRITPKGKWIVDSGGWKAYITKKRQSEANNERLANLNLTLAESNIEANKISKRDSKINRRGFIINVIFGAVNLILLLISLLTS